MNIEHNIAELQATIQEFWHLRKKPMSFLLSLAGKKFSAKAAQIFKQEVMPPAHSITNERIAALEAGQGIKVKDYRMPNPWGGGDIYTSALLFAEPRMLKTRAAKAKAKARQSMREDLLNKYGFATAAMTGRSSSGLKASSIRGMTDRAMRVYWEIQNREWHRGFVTSAMVFAIRDGSTTFSKNNKRGDRLGKAESVNQGSDDHAAFQFTWGDVVSGQSKKVAQGLNRPRSQAAIAKAIALTTADFRQDIQDRLAGMTSKDFKNRALKNA